MHDQRIGVDKRQRTHIPVNVDLDISNIYINIFEFVHKTKSQFKMLFAKEMEDPHSIFFRFIFSFVSFAHFALSLT